MDSSRMQITIRPMRKPKRFRSAFTTEQIKYLELQFKKFPYISSEHRKEIASTLNMQERAVKIWFQNRRMKEKKESINKETDFETTAKAEESGKNRLSNIITVSSAANDQLINSLPITVKPLGTCTNFPVANNDGSLRETLQTLETQQVPQNLSMHHKKSSTNIYQDLNVDHQPPFLDGFASTQSEELTRKQFKNINPQIPRKHVEVSMDQGKRLKKVKKEINQDHKVKAQRKLELHSPVSVKSRVPCIERMPSKKKTTPQVASRLSKQANEATYFPVMPTVYAHPYISSGGVIWKPINLMPVVTPGNAIPVPSNPQQNFGHVQKSNCGCNCHGSALPLTGTKLRVTSPYTQYVFTAPEPYQNSSPKF